MESHAVTSRMGGRAEPYVIPMGTFKRAISGFPEVSHRVTNSHSRGAKYLHNARGGLSLYNSTRRGPPFALNEQAKFASGGASI
jgi:hypothetical protein